MCPHSYFLPYSSIGIISSPLTHTLSTTEQNVRFTLFKTSVSFFSAKTIQCPIAFQILILLKASPEKSSLAVGLINSPRCWYLLACQFRNPFLSTTDHCRERSALTKRDSRKIRECKDCKCMAQRLPLVKIINSLVVNKITSGMQNEMPPLEKGCVCSGNFKDNEYNIQ